MNLEKLHSKLIAIARKNRPSDAVPFAFENRIMARLALPLLDAWSAWGRLLWRAAAVCVVAVALIGGWTGLSHDSVDLSQEFENTVFAELEEPSVIASEESW